MNITKTQITIEATMSSIGVFRKVDVDEESYLVYASPLHDEALAMSSGANNLSFQPLFSCPYSRFLFHTFNLKKDDDGNELNELEPHNISPYFPNTKTVDHEGQSLLDCNDPRFCSLPVIPLPWCNSEEPDYDQFQCGACFQTMLSTNYYACVGGCEGKFHKECVETPLKIKHPSHPFHSIRLYNFLDSSKSCISCKQEINNIGYHCSTCDLSMHQVCAMKTVPVVINHPKSHPHPLTFFPAQASLVCNICATIKKLDPTYICVQCVFVIHQDCIGFPHVIRISRHIHRIFFTLSLPSGNLSCGVCREQIDNNYGAYTCNKCDAYFVHSKCALHPDLWDSKELEGVPEEEDIIDDGEPFKRIADGIILHPFHSHQLQLEIKNGCDMNKYCRACGLPTSEVQFYSCMECNFIIHESCASAPRMIRHPLYPHPLTLHHTIGPDNDAALFRCSECERDGTGFFYEHIREGETFRLDLRCASIIEPFEYKGHEHPLYLPWNPGKSTQCQMCKYESLHSTLICLICDYTICYSCAALPYEVKYKHDSHLLTICDGKEASDEPDWCESCECMIEEVKETGYRGDMNRKVERRYYECKECCTALHVDCLLGIDMYMKPDNTEKDYLSLSKFSSRRIKRKVRMQCFDVRILLNNSLSRPMCTGCEHRCPFPIVFKADIYNTIFCSWNCIGIWIRSLITL